MVLGLRMPLSNLYEMTEQKATQSAIKKVMLLLGF